MEVVGNSSEIGSVGVDVYDDLGRQPSTSSGGGITSTGATASCSNAQVQPPLASLTTAVPDVWNNCWEYGAQSASGSLPPANPCGKNVKLTCLFCFRLTSQRIQPQIEENEVNARRSASLKNLCDQMKLGKDEIPDQCLKEMFPFCNGCQKMVDNLWEYKKELMKIQVKMAETVKEIQRKVADGELLQPKMKNPKHPLVFAAEAKKFTRLREMILEAYREALWVNVSEQHDSCTEENTDEVDGVWVAAENGEPVMGLTIPVLTAETSAATKNFIPAHRPGDGIRLSSSFAVTPPITELPSSFSAAITAGTTYKEKNYSRVVKKNSFTSDKRTPAGEGNDGGRKRRGKHLSCIFCAKSLASKGGLMQHLHTHTGEKPFNCNLCSVTFGFKFNLKVHLKTHTGEKPFECNVCHKMFALKSGLAVHIRVHTGERPFKCDVCCKTFINTSNLNKHRNIHQTNVDLLSVK